jgi:hypothetical protein
MRMRRISDAWRKGFLPTLGKVWNGTGRRKKLIQGHEYFASARDKLYFEIEDS